MQLIYTAEAIADLQRLRDFIADNNPDAAHRIGRDLVQRMGQLKEMPRMGKPVASAPDPEVIRDMIFGKQTVRYAVHAQTLAILRIWHHYENNES